MKHDQDNFQAMRIYNTVIYKRIKETCRNTKYQFVTYGLLWLKTVCSQ